MDLENNYRLYPRNFSMRYCSLETFFFKGHILYQKPLKSITHADFKKKCPPISTILKLKLFLFFKLVIYDINLCVSLYLRNTCQVNEDLFINDYSTPKLCNLLHFVTMEIIQNFKKVAFFQIFVKMI